MCKLVSTGAKYKHKHYVCHYCLYPFLNEDRLKEHTIMCRQHQSQQIRHPTPHKDEVLKFTKFNYQFPVPFVIYADFECLLEKNESDHSVMHVPSGFCACHLVLKHPFCFYDGNLTFLMGFNLITRAAFTIDAESRCVV